MVLVDLNTSNLLLEGTTRRATLLQSLERKLDLDALREPLLRFSPSDPSFGIIRVGSAYTLRVTMITTGDDVARVRLGHEPPEAVHPPEGNGNEVGDEEGEGTELNVSISNTKLTPGLPQSLTLTVQAKTEGKYKWRVKIVGEEHVYWLEVECRVMGGESFHALAALARLEGRRELNEGVTFLRELNSPTRELSPGASKKESAISKHNNAMSEEESVARDSIVGLYPKTVDMDELSWFPTLSGIYWDKNRDCMALDSDCYRNIVIDGKAPLNVCEDTYKAYEESKMQEKEKGGHLTRRCLEGLKVDGSVERKVFRTLCEALE